MSSDDLKRQQWVVARGVMLGLLSLFAIIASIYHGLDPIVGMEQASSRLLFALGQSLVAVIPLMVGIGAVANSRFLSQSINPLAGADTGRILVFGKFLTNTLEQFVMFFVVTLVLSLFLDGEGMRLIPALTANFVVARLVFLGGYLKHPLYRAPGFAMTMYPTVFFLVYDLYKIFSVGTPRV